jgi:heme-degrading monooxygenase HmoA
MEKVIIRIWHGRTKATDADTYLQYIEDTGIIEYKNIKGNLSAEIWRKIDGDICHFWTVTKWDSFESIKLFAGKDYEKARYFAHDANYLLEFEEHVQHMEGFIY